MTKKYQKEEIILSTTNAIRYILKIPNSEVLEKHKKDLLDEMIWKLTEAGGKHNQRYISEGVDLKRKSGDWSIKGLRLEHVYTRKSIISELLACPSDMNSILEKAIGCVVTAEEHDKLPHRDYFGWDRYKQAKIRVWDTQLNQWKIDKKDFL